jgi:calnexin
MGCKLPKSLLTPQADEQDEEDGDWIPPMVPNPKCEDVGCGPWSAPSIRNPDYKGKWTVPKIANPEYKGEWAPRQVSNPAFFEDSSPSDFTKIAGIGIELWTMTEDILCESSLSILLPQLIISRQHLCWTRCRPGQEVCCRDVPR